MSRKSDLAVSWKEIQDKLEPQFGGDLDIQAVLFIIGVQELGKGYVKLDKEDKVNVMHIAICTLLEPYGFYEYIGRDADLWPHWKALKPLPNLKAGEQNRLLLEAMMEYFRKEGLIE
jgi:hypothetical protein